MSHHQRYTPEFRSEAVKLVTEQGLSQSVAAKRLGIPAGTLAGWISALKSSVLPSGSLTTAELIQSTAGYAESWQKPRWSVTY